MGLAAPAIDRRLDLFKAYADLQERSPHSQEVRDLVDAGIAPLGGGAQGLNPAVFMNNVPAPGSYVIDQPRFDLLTERNDLPQTVENWPGFGARIDKKIANVGVLANIKLRVTLSMVVSGTGAVTSNYRFPYNLIKALTLNANGGSAIINVEGLDLKARRARVFRNPREELASFPGQEASGTLKTAHVIPGVIANGTYAVVFDVDVPIVHDPRSLTGALFAQSDQNYLNWILQTAQLGDCFSIAAGGAVAITGQVDSTLTFYAIPTMDAQNGRVVVLPKAVRWLHEFIGQDKQFANNGKVDTTFIRNNGQLVAAIGYINNGGQAQIAPAALERLTWMYAGNQTPRDFNPVTQLLKENQDDYNGLLQPGYFALDFEKDNPQRDLVYPRGLAELSVRITIPSTITPNANSNVHLALETLTGA